MELKTNYFFKISLIFFFLTVGTTVHANISDIQSYSELQNNLENELEDKKSSVMGRWIENITDSKVSFGLKFLDLDLIDGLNISSKYKYAAEPSFKTGYHARIDKIRTRFTISPGDMIAKDGVGPLYVNIEKGTEIVFVRQFKCNKKKPLPLEDPKWLSDCKKTALTKKPYSLKNLPTTAERVLKRMVPGDFVSMPLNLNLALGASANSSDYGVPGLEGALYGFFKGRFMVQVFRMRNDHARVRLFVMNQRGTGISGKANVDLEIWGIKIFDKAVELLIDPDLAQLGLEKSKGNIFLADFIFNLKDEKARLAYNKIISSTYKFKSPDIKVVFKKGKKVPHMFVSSLVAAEQLHFEDIKKKNPRVKRLFKGFNKFNKVSRNLAFDHRILKYNKSFNSTFNKIIYWDKYGMPKNYLYATAEKDHLQEFDIELLQFYEKQTATFFGLFTQNSDDPSDVHFSDYGFQLLRNDFRLSKREEKNFRSFLKNNLPGFFWEQISWKDWSSPFEFGHKKKIDSFLSVQIAFSKSAYEQLSRYNTSELKDEFDRYYQSFREQNLLESTDNALIEFLEKFNPLSWYYKYKRNKIVKYFYEVFSENSPYSKYERVERMIHLNRNALFRKLGIGFIFYLLDPLTYNQNSFVSLNLRAKGKKDIRLKLGFRDDFKTGLLLQLQQIQLVLNQNDNDYRIHQLEGIGDWF